MELKYTVIVASLLAIGPSSVVLEEELYKLCVIHLNDFHARFEETHSNSALCKNTDYDCIGGFSRVFTEIRRLKSECSNSVLLNAGDNFQGTLWYNLYKWNITQEFLNLLPTDAFTLGNHEFDDGIKGVLPFIEHLHAPTVVANIDDSEQPEIQGKYKKSLVIEKGGKRIGIIGVIYSKTNEISSTEKLKFLDESEAVNKEAERLVENNMVDIIIVLSHSGYNVDKHIAKNAAPKIGLIVGGHSHTFLYTGGNSPGPDKPLGPYPTVVKHEDGRDILVVQASAFTKYLGDINILFDDYGNIANWTGAPIYLSHDIQQDKDVNKKLDKWKVNVDAVGNKVLGFTKVELSNSDCKYAECNLGNLLTDAMVYSYLPKAENGYWAYAAIAILNSGGIRASMNKGNITVGDALVVAPFQDTYDIGEMQGKYLRELLEECVDKSISAGKLIGNSVFLQVSGIHVVYNVTKPLGSRVVSVVVRCNECNTPKYEPLLPKKYYRIILDSYAAAGKGGITVISDHLKNHVEGTGVDIDVLAKYISHASPIIQGLEERIIVLE